MRLVCPNCDAQYEVDDGAVPETGRDVQCSNCGHTWFQMPPDLEAELEAEEALFGVAARPQDPKPVAAPTVASTPPTVAPPKASAWDDDADDDDEEDDADEDEGGDEAAEDADDHSTDDLKIIARTTSVEISVPLPQEPDTQDDEPTEPARSETQMPQPVAPRRGLDESLLSVLREEAEREAAVRRSETPRALETQPELGLEETTGAASAAKAVRDRLARLRGQEAEPEITEKPTARRDLLPDIEEINSTLRASTENRSGDELAMADPAPVTAATNTGFRSGFSLMLLIAVLLIATYLAAPKIATQFPAAQGALESYVAGVDAARIWLDSAMRSAISAVQNLTGGSDS